jgi:HD-GYP domain-containing protein (c-di-GMP phosphodiesterase class II)
MRMVSVKEIQPGMVLARPIYRAEDGRILLPANCKLKPSFIDKINDHGCSYIYIQEPEEKQIESIFFKPIKDETRAKANAILKKTFDQVKNENIFYPGEIHEVVQEIVKHILSDSQIMYNMYNLRSYDEYTYSHSVNVCVISTLIGSSIGYNQNELEIIGTGAMLHDIGKVLIEPHILNKPNKLDINEYTKMQSHTILGFDLLKKSIPMGFIPAEMALQHHEREDGSGYPGGLDKKNIHPFSKIVAVADVFDSMTSNRIYQKAIPAYLAIKELKSKANIKYNYSVVEHFTKVVTPYPIGTVLLVNNKEQVVVTHVSRAKGVATVKSSSGEEKTFNINDFSEIKIVKLG